jgi:tryptophan synthase beta chain
MRRIAMSAQRSPYFGRFGGRYVPEVLIHALDELEAGVAAAFADDAFWSEYRDLMRDFVGRPSPLLEARGFGEDGPTVVFKREDCNHTGSHKINNAVGQGLLARRLGKTRIIAETGAGQHGVATATIGARFGLPVEIFMGVCDVERQAPNVRAMRLLGATIRSVDSGTQTLKDATNEALREWAARSKDTYYLVGSAVGPHPYPYLVRELQSVIGAEARTTILDRYGKLPTDVVACVGGGSNAIGIFSAFLADPTVRLWGVEAAGSGVSCADTAATISAGRAGYLHGAASYVLQDGDGQIRETHSLAAGLDYPGVGPEHAQLHESGRVRYVAIDDDRAAKAFRACALREGIIPALESAHALAFAGELSEDRTREDLVLVNLSGRGDKDLMRL